jgi:hypothetical protein
MHTTNMRYPLVNLGVIVIEQSTLVRRTNCLSLLPVLTRNGILTFIRVDSPINIRNKCAVLDSSGLRILPPATVDIRNYYCVLLLIMNIPFED